MYKTRNDLSANIREQSIALGGRADGTARVAAKQSAVAEFPFDITTGVAHVAAVADRLGAFGASVRAAIDSAAQFGDADTADIFTEISREMDKQLWFIEAHLQADK